MSIPLSTCPFCKEPGATIKPDLTNATRSYVGCNKCKARGPVTSNMDKAIAHWNYLSDNPWIKQSRILQETLKKISETSDLEKVMGIANDTLKRYGVNA